jgi:hypothetical protein
MSMRTQEALRRIKRHRPTSLNDFKALSLLGKYVGSGVFRETFRVKGTNLIVKFPLNEARSERKPVYKSGIAHTRTEMRRFYKLRRVKALRSHLPKIWYFDPRHGIVVMTHYAKFGGYGGRNKIELLGQVINKLMRQYAHTPMNDIHGDNTRMAGGKFNKRIVFVDLGF